MKFSLTFKRKERQFVFSLGPIFCVLDRPSFFDMFKGFIFVAQEAEPLTEEESEIVRKASEIVEKYLSK